MISLRRLLRNALTAVLGAWETTNGKRDYTGYKEKPFHPEHSHTEEYAQGSCAVSSLEGFKTQLDKALSNLVWSQVTLPWAEGWIRDFLRSLPNSIPPWFVNDRKCAISSWERTVKWKGDRRNKNGWESVAKCSIDMLLFRSEATRLDWLATVCGFIYFMEFREQNALWPLSRSPTNY